ncbi:hypothetical protein BLNAU_11314 [Blattamonas nauphoetae]|uniref:SAGA-associated factor 11 n=1 Tax=Blattamonas nauphoetae TaxID=2049346 RepID=A0ABQ9XS84_9EUKA|nr:hypothetical protein BLNAU_11314 [Blattamonas nauphoetae]
MSKVSSMNEQEFRDWDEIVPDLRCSLNFRDPAPEIRKNSSFVSFPLDEASVLLQPPYLVQCIHCEKPVLLSSYLSHYSKCFRLNTQRLSQRATSHAQFFQNSSQSNKEASANNLDTDPSSLSTAEISDILGSKVKIPEISRDIRRSRSAPPVLLIDTKDGPTKETVFPLTSTDGTTTTKAVLCDEELEFIVDMPLTESGVSPLTINRQVNVDGSSTWTLEGLHSIAIRPSEDYLYPTSQDMLLQPLTTLHTPSPLNFILPRQPFPVRSETAVESTRTRPLTLRYPSTASKTQDSDSSISEDDSLFSSSEELHATSPVPVDPFPPEQPLFTHNLRRRTPRRISDSPSYPTKIPTPPLKQKAAQQSLSPQTPPQSPTPSVPTLPAIAAQKRQTPTKKVVRKSKKKSTSPIHTGHMPRSSIPLQQSVHAQSKQVKKKGTHPAAKAQGIPVHIAGLPNAKGVHRGILNTSLVQLNNRPSQFIGSKILKTGNGGFLTNREGQVMFNPSFTLSSIPPSNVSLAPQQNILGRTSSFGHNPVGLLSGNSLGMYGTGLHGLTSDGMHGMGNVGGMVGLHSLLPFDGTGMGLGHGQLGTALHPTVTSGHSIGSFSVLSNPASIQPNGKGLNYPISSSFGFHTAQRLISKSMLTNSQPHDAANAQTGLQTALQNAQAHPKPAPTGDGDTPAAPLAAPLTAQTYPMHLFHQQVGYSGSPQLYLPSLSPTSGSFANRQLTSSLLFKHTRPTNPDLTISPSSTQSIGNAQSPVQAGLQLGQSRTLADRITPKATGTILPHTTHPITHSSVQSHNLVHPFTPRHNTHLIHPNAASMTPPAPHPKTNQLIPSALNSLHKMGDSDHPVNHQPHILPKPTSSPLPPHSGLNYPRPTPTLAPLSNSVPNPPPQPK